MKFGIYVVRNKLSGLLHTPNAFLFHTDEEAAVELFGFVHNRPDEFEAMRVGDIDIETGLPTPFSAPTYVQFNSRRFPRESGPELVRTGTPQEIEEQFNEVADKVRK